MHKHILCDTFKSQLLHVNDNHLYFIFFLKRRWFFCCCLLLKNLTSFIPYCIQDILIEFWDHYWIWIYALVYLHAWREFFNFFLCKLMVNCITNLTGSACDKYSVVLIQYKSTLCFRKVFNWKCLCLYDGIILLVIVYEWSLFLISFLLLHRTVVLN